jgi:hypothetical protein
MKKILVGIIAMLIVFIFLGSCKKYSSPNTMDSGNERIILFQLYTSKDFSDETSVVDFSVFVRTAYKTIFDSAFTSIRLNEIPDAVHKLALEKTISGYDHQDLAAGFRYTVRNVGNSSYIDTSKEGNPFKVIDFNFQ